MKDEIKQLRERLECYIHLTKELKPNKLYSSYTKPYKTVTGEQGQLIESSNSKEIEKAVDSLFLAKCWVEKTITQFIDQDGDVNKTIVDLEIWQSYDHYEKVEFIISQIKECIDINADVPVRNNRLVLSAGNNTFQHLSEARFWLEVEMDRYYESQKGPKVD